MRYLDVINLKKCLIKFHINPIKIIDIGGTKEVNLDGTIKINPLLNLFPSVIFLDKGFNLKTLNSSANYYCDFLERENIREFIDNFDLVVSFDTLEHIIDPITFCENLILITNVNGWIYISTVFEWVYHPSPEDYYRFSPNGLKAIFSSAITRLDANVSIILCEWGDDQKGVRLLARKKSLKEDFANIIENDLNTPNDIYVAKNEEGKSKDSLKLWFKKNINLIYRKKIEIY